MELDIITQYLLAIVPAFTAVVGMAVTLGVGIGKIKKANRETIEKVDVTDKRVSKHTASLETQLAEVHRENVELKKQLRKIMAKLEHIHFVDTDEEE